MTPMAWDMKRIKGKMPGMIIFDLDDRQRKVRLVSELNLEKYRSKEDATLDNAPGFYRLAMLVIRDQYSKSSNVEGHYYLATMHPRHDGVWIKLNDSDVTAYQLPDEYAENVHLVIYFREDWVTKLAQED